MLRMADTPRTYDVVGRVVQRMESFHERGELGFMGTTISVKFTDGTEINLFVSAHTEVAAEVLPARKRPQRLAERDGRRSRTATA